MINIESTNAPRHVDLNIKTGEKFIDFFLKNIARYRVVMFDIDGTLLRGYETLSEVIELIQIRTWENFPFVLLTNDTRSTEEKAGLT